MKRILNIMILIIILIGMSTLVYADTPTNNVTLSSSSQTANVGENVTITLKTSQKIQAADFKINYSSDILEFVSTSIDEEHINSNNVGKIIVSTYSTKGIDEFTFIFKVKKEGNIEVSTDIEALSMDTNSSLPFENKILTITALEKAPTIEVSSVTLDKTNSSIEIGKTVKLTATVAPNNATDKTVTWTSSDISVATVSNGTVTGVKKGTATITATAGEKSASCTITVTEVQQSKPDDDNNEDDKKIEVTSVTLDKSTASMKVGENLKLLATITPENATNKNITWKSSDTSIATVSNGTIKALKAGNVTITATSGTKSVNCNITITNTFNNSNNNNKGDTSGVSKVPDKDTSNNDQSVSKQPIPQTGETLVVIGTIIGFITILIISVIKYKKYRDII